MANPIEERLVTTSELLEHKRPGAPTVIDPLADHVPLDAEAVVSILKAHHTASVLLGLLESPKRGKGKKEQMRRLAVGLVRHLELLAGYIRDDARGRSR